MKTIGEILKTTREKQNLTIDQIAKATRIQARFITLLEANRFEALPESTFVKGFIRNYAQVLGKDPQVLLAIFRRDYGQDAKGKVIPRGLLQPVNQSKLRWTPTATIIAATTVLITLFIAYLLIQFRSLSGTPPLSVTNPQENAVVSSLVTIEGTTNSQAALKINSQPVTVDDQGKFNTTISLTQGEHTITLEATSRTGQTKLLQRTVKVE